MTPEILKQVEALGTDAHAAEVLCGRLGAEFHPIACDAVRDAIEEGARCNHLPYDVRAARVAAYAKLTGAKPDKSVKPKPKFVAVAAAPGVTSPFDSPAPAEPIEPEPTVDSPVEVLEKSSTKATKKK